MDLSRSMSLVPHRHATNEVNIRYDRNINDDEEEEEEKEDISHS